MNLCDIFKVDGKSLFPPDQNLSISFEDLDGPDSGRDESGFMHRVVLRYKLGTWSFEYSHITDEEYAYMESVFGNKSSFEFTHPSRTDFNSKETTTAYRSKYGIVWHSAKTGDFRNYKFNIIEC